MRSHAWKTSNWKSYWELYIGYANANVSRIIANHC
jgi:hypothetical protein